MNFALVLIPEKGNPAGSGLNDVREPLLYALRTLGHTAELVDSGIARHARNIVFGLHDMPKLDQNLFPPDTIIYNLEQITAGSRALEPHYLDALQRFTVWEYSARNLERLRDLIKAPRCVHVPLGYMPQMRRINPDYPKDIDVLLYGFPNTRRMLVMDELKRRRINALIACGVYGEQRDGLIARSRLQLNVHFYKPGILEVVRLSYLLANALPVVSELNPDTEMISGFEHTCFFTAYDDLADVVENALGNAAACRKQAEKGHALFKAMPYTDIVECALDAG